MPGLSVKLYECRVLGTRPESRVITCISRRGRKFINLSYLLPYINQLGGGFDFVPQEGDECLVLADDVSGFEVCVGFRLRLTVNESEGGLELGNRVPDFNRGSVGLRAVGEDGSDARVLCYRGGTVLIGSGKLANTVYSPIDSSILHLFDNWEMQGPGGHLKWKREGGKDKVSYAAEYRTVVSDETSDFRVNVDIAQGDTPVAVSVKRGKNDEHPPLELTVDSQGMVKVKGMVMEVDMEGKFEVKAPNIILNGRRIIARDDPI